MQFLSKFRHTSWIGMFKTVIKVRSWCPVVFYEEIIAVFELKKSQIGTEIDKKPKNFQFSKFLCNIGQLFDRHRELKCLKCSICQKFVVQ